jgi:hypothetical protein
LSVYVSANQLAKEEVEHLERGNLAESGEEGCTSTRLSLESMGNDAATKLQSLISGWEDIDTSRTSIGTIGSNVQQIVVSHSINTAPSD